MAVLTSFCGERAACPEQFAGEFKSLFLFNDIKVITNLAPWYL